MTRKAPNQGSTPAKRSDEYYTPASVIALVHTLFGGAPELDPASSAVANQTVQATRYFTQADNGLSQPWLATTVFMNPPFSLKVRFVEKLHHAYQAGSIGEALCLIPATVDTLLWQRYIRLYPWCAWSGRIDFLTGHQGVTFPSAIIYFGRRLDAFCDVFGAHGLIYPPALSAGRRAAMQQIFEVV